MPTHSIWSTNPLRFRDGNTNTEYDAFTRGSAAGLWTENTRNGYFYAVARVTPGAYKFILVAITGSDVDSITGLWDIRHNGVLVGNNYVGKVYGMDQPPGNNYFKIYIGDAVAYHERWHYSGYITNRFDF